MRFSDWSSDVCSSDRAVGGAGRRRAAQRAVAQERAAGGQGAGHQQLRSYRSTVQGKGSVDRPAAISSSGGMMQQLKTILSALVLALAVSGSPGVSAHSVEDLESMLGDREKYFQPMDRKAPDFTLRTAEGKAISLADQIGREHVLT